MISLICGVIKKKKRLIEIENRLVTAGDGGGVRGRMRIELEVGTSSHGMSKRWTCKARHVTAVNCAVSDI